ncbi:expressed unknown protein [Seminavis robusta]|uniref:Uncharacterized protein n=1 Tax=Seminavis robusta TaxID=568900 RepID=A0A9N8DH94_9STRA|nr:expressed unknown protein [Seminavis robusta]|eukprot:Sro142_g066210.1 n/a (550) ;mRNA; r:43784-45433
MGEDIFKTLVRMGLRHARENTDDTSFAYIPHIDKGFWSVMVVDEAQALLKKLGNYFLSSDGTKDRFAFSAVIKAMATVPRMNGFDTGFPLVAGTGMSIDGIREASESIMAKDTESKEFLFTKFKPLDADAVKRYLCNFLDVDLSEPGNSIALEHISKWLRGRPRWTATFLEVYLVRARIQDYKGTRGQLPPVGTLLIQALDRYLDVYTSDDIKNIPQSDRRKPFDPPEGTAFGAIKKVVTECEYEVAKWLESAIFKFVVGGKSQIIDRRQEELIVIGVAAVSADGNYKGVLDEPIIIQAGINCFSLTKSVINNLISQETGGQGEAFEKLLLPAIQKNFHNILREQHGTDVVLTNKKVPHRSAYGVLARQCSHPEQTMQWIEDATTARVEGQVPPFCYPDTKIGPDLMFLMWNADYSQYIFVISQVKYRKDFKRTMTPDLLYHEKRDKSTEQFTHELVDDVRLKRRWEEDIKPKVVGGEFGCLRFMVQYPKKQTRSAEPGTLADSDVKVGTISNKKQKVGWLATVSGTNASCLFDRDGLKILKALKGDDE